MRAVFFIFMIFLSAFVFADEKVIKGKVLDENDKPVAYASVGIVGTSFGTISNEEGVFVFYLPPTLTKTDSLKISCIGYSSKKYQAVSLPATITVQLMQQSSLLPEIMVSSTKTKTKKVGNKREDTFMNCNFTISDKPNQNLGSEIGRKFFFKGKKHRLKKFNLYCAYNFDTVTLRLNIYDLKKGLPDQSLITQNIILHLKGPKRGWHEVDLESYNLIFDQNIVVTVQWIGHSKRGKVLQLPITMPVPGSVHFYKFGSQDKWKRYNAMSTSMNLDVEVGEE